MNDDFRPLKKPRATAEISLRYDPYFKTLWSKWSYVHNGFMLTVIVLNLRISISFVKENYS